MKLHVLPSKCGCVELRPQIHPYGQAPWNGDVTGGIHGTGVGGEGSDLKKDRACSECWDRSCFYCKSCCKGGEAKGMAGAL